MGRGGGASGVAVGGVEGVAVGCRSAHCLLRVEGIWKPLMFTRLPDLVGLPKSVGGRLVALW